LNRANDSSAAAGKDLERAHAGRDNPIVLADTGNRPAKDSSRIGNLIP